MLPGRQGRVTIFLSKIPFDPSPESLLQSHGLLITEPLANFVPRVPLTQHRKDFPDVRALVLFYAALDQLY
jgi:hypothetical protein